MEITKGKLKSAQKVVIYGPEGIGKSTFAANFPAPLFIDTEGSTKMLDVARTPKPTSWAMLLEQINYIKKNPSVCKTLVVDTIDWAEQLCIADVCAKAGKKGVEDFGYGKGYTYEKEAFGGFLNLLSELIDMGINVVLTAHAQLKKFEQPDEAGAYDRWELKLGQKTGSQISPLVKEWADLVLFANYKTYAVAADDKGKKFKAQGGERVMYTSHHPCWDAKNRHGLAPEIAFSYHEIAHCIDGDFDIIPAPVTVEQEAVLPPSKVEKTAIVGVGNLADFEEIYTPPTAAPVPADIPKPLADLMIENGVSEEDIRKVVAEKGYFPLETPIKNYPEDFINGVLIGAWEKVFAMIKENKNIPF